jgi:hypothetical protein
VALHDSEITEVLAAEVVEHEVDEVVPVLLVETLVLLVVLACILQSPVSQLLMLVVEVLVVKVVEQLDEYEVVVQELEQPRQLVLQILVEVEDEAVLMVDSEQMADLE